MSDSLKDKCAIVTGSGQGIGRAIAIGLAREGARVVTNNRCPGSTGRVVLTEAQEKLLREKLGDKYEKEINAIRGDAETTAREIRDSGGEAVAFFGDIADFATASRLVQTAIDNFGKVDILVNVAGTFGFSNIETMTEALWDKVTLVKPKGYFNTIRHAVPYMIEQKWGRIINCTSKAFLGDAVKHAEYCAANAGVVGLTRALAIELRGHGITCNAFAPFALTRASYELEACSQVSRGDETIWIQGDTGFPAFLTPGPEYIAPFIAYLASESAANISGSVFSLGGNEIGIYSEPVVINNLTKLTKEPWTVEELRQRVPQELLTGYRSLADNPLSRIMNKAKRLFWFVIRILSGK